MADKNSVNDSIILTMMVESIQETNNGVNVLYDMVCKGYDGQPPILVRISTLEKNDISILEDLKEIKGFQMQFKIENRKSQWNFAGLLLLSIVGWLTAIISHTSDSPAVQWLINTLTGGK